MKPNPSLYATDWHQCLHCGFSRPERGLRRLRVTDEVLQLEHYVWRCTDEEACERFRLELAARVSPPVRSRK